MLLRRLSSSITAENHIVQNSCHLQFAMVKPALHLLFCQPVSSLPAFCQTQRKHYIQQHSNLNRTRLICRSFRDEAVQMLILHRQQACQSARILFVNASFGC
ncbi:hypothetical protein D3C80_1831220 [compost metagenome]